MGCTCSTIFRHSLATSPCMSRVSRRYRRWKRCREKKLTIILNSAIRQHFRKSPGWQVTYVTTKFDDPNPISRNNILRVYVHSTVSVQSLYKVYALISSVIINPSFSSPGTNRYVIQARSSSRVKYSWIVVGQSRKTLTLGILWLIDRLAEIYFMFLL